MTTLCKVKHSHLKICISLNAISQHLKLLWKKNAASLGKSVCKLKSVSVRLVLPTALATRFHRQGVQALKELHFN